MAETAEVVVLNSLSYRDPRDQATDPTMYRYQYADRGQKITIRSEDLERFESLGAVTTDTSAQEAKLAQAGRPEGGSVGAAVIPSEAAQIRAVQSAATAGGGVGPHSTTYELMNVDTTILRLFAKAFGVEVGENDSKQDLAEKLTARAEGVDKITQERDQIQVAARESGGETGLLGAGVLSGGRDAESGEKLDTSKAAPQGKADKKN